MTKATKATAQTLNTERATKAMQTAEAQVLKATETAVKALNDCVASASADLIKLQTAAEDKRAELDALNGEYAEKLDTEQYNLRIAVRDNRQATLATLLREDGTVAVKPSVIETLERDLAVALQDNAEKIKAEVGKAQGIERAKAEREQADLISEHKVAIANYQAQSRSDAATIELLKGQIADLKDTLEKNRDAETQRMEAVSQSQVVVNNGK